MKHNGYFTFQMIIDTSGTIHIFTVATLVTEMLFLDSLCVMVAVKYFQTITDITGVWHHYCRMHVSTREYYYLQKKIQKYRKFQLE